MSEAHKITNWAILHCKKFNTYIDIGAHNGDIHFVTPIARVYVPTNPITNSHIHGKDVSRRKEYRNCINNTKQWL